MPVQPSRRQPLLRLAATALLLALVPGLSGCASIGDNMSAAFADPAKYGLYECKQLEPERKSLAARAKELEGLMAKAETGVAGSVVAEVAYRNDLISVHSQQKLADEAWERNKCQETPPPPPVPSTPAPAKPKAARSRS